MRSNLIAMLASASIVSASVCAQNNLEELVAETSCGSIEAITKCLGSADLQRLDEIERCYSSNGCSAGSATVEAVWFKKDCDVAVVEKGRGDLKIRADSDSSTSEGKTTSAKTTSAKTTSAKTTSTPASTSATTTSTTSDSSTSTSGTTASSTTSSSTTASTTGSTTSTGSSTSTLVCSTTETKDTTVCNTTSGSKTCTSTTTEIASCAPGNICFASTSTAEAAICMKRDDSLTTSGLIVTIIFGFAVGVTAVVFAIMGFRNSAKTKSEERKRLLAAASTRGGGDVEAQSTSALPLITPGGTRSDQTSYSRQPQQDYFSDAGGGSGNSVTPPGQRGGAAPQLHPGLGALGQERY